MHHRPLSALAAAVANPAPGLRDDTTIVDACASNGHTATVTVRRMHYTAHYTEALFDEVCDACAMALVSDDRTVDNAILPLAE